MEVLECPVTNKCGFIASDFWHCNYKAQSWDMLIMPGLHHVTELHTRKARSSKFTCEHFKNKDQG